jgi:hypothetical protein
MSLSRSTRHRVAVRARAVLVIALAGASIASAAPAASSITLVQGATYRARLRLSFFQCLASESTIRRKLAGSGFAETRVFMSARELPADWPAQFRRKAGSCERYAEGVWVKSTMPRDRPSSIESWWIKRS